MCVCISGVMKEHNYPLSCLFCGGILLAAILLGLIAFPVFKIEISSAGFFMSDDRTERTYSNNSSAHILGLVRTPTPAGSGPSNASVRGASWGSGPYRNSEAPRPASVQGGSGGTGTCDVFKGKWVYDPGAEAPYSARTCPVLSRAQDCQGNGRPDGEYIRWHWTPDSCQLPRFNASAFLRIMHGKLLAFVGDSVTRNHMESLMCTLMQVENPRNKGNKRMQRWYFVKSQVTIVRIWSSWLVKTDVEHVEGVPDDATKLYIDEVDSKFFDFLPEVDVLVIGSGHWFMKKSAYITGGDTPVVAGAQGWSSTALNLTVTNVEAFERSTRTAVNAISSSNTFKGLTILRTYSPDHYHGGTWNSGGWCSGKTGDVARGLDPFASVMRQIQIEAAKNVPGVNRIRVMDVTGAFSGRGDGHPGPFRSPGLTSLRDNTVVKGKPPPQDCLHWCMPGPVDTWNEFLFHILKEELAS